jgi:hypothetical protein
MTASSLKVRSLVLIAAMTAVVSVAVASPLTLPPQPPLPGVILAASPLTLPPQPPLPGVILAASPLTLPPQPPLPGVTA